MKALIIGAGAAGNKAVVNLLDPSGQLSGGAFRAEGYANRQYSIQESVAR